MSSDYAAAVAEDDERFCAIRSSRRRSWSYASCQRARWSPPRRRAFLSYMSIITGRRHAGDDFGLILVEALPCDFDLMVDKALFFFRYIRKCQNTL